MGAEAGLEPASASDGIGQVGRARWIGGLIGLLVEEGDDIVGRIYSMVAYPMVAYSTLACSKLA